MLEPEIAYTAGDPAELDRIVAALGERFRVETEPAPRRRLYYDTFDWRLWRRRSRLWQAPADGGGARLIWQTEGRPRPLRLDLGPDVEIGFAADLPSGRFRHELAEVISVRRLLPIVDVRADGRLLRVLDRRRKTVVRLFAEAPVARAPGAGEPHQRLAPILIVRPVRGYSAAYREAVDFLGGDLGLDPWDADELEAAAALGGFGAAGGYSSKPRVALDPAAPAGQALRLLLLKLLETIERNRAGTIADLDSEFLHDFRVAVRRTRTLLGQTKKAWEKEAIRRFRREFAWLGEITGPTRDLDVHLLELPGHAAALPEAVRADLEPLGRLLERKRRAAQAALASELESDRYRQLVASWRSFLEATPDPDAPPPRARRPIGELADRVIARAHRRLLERGGAIDDDSPPAALHRLRIDGKKLRYALELFRTLYPPAEIDRLVRALKRLQDTLGAFNDCGVQRQMLYRFGAELGAGRGDSVPALLALGRLVADLDRREAKERARFSKRFARFGSRKTGARFRALRAAGRSA